MALGRLVSTASEIASPVLDTVRTLTDSSSDRRSWTGDGRVHLEVRGMHHPGTVEAARALEERLTEMEHVRSAEVNAALGRVVISHGTEPVARSALIDVVTEIEREYGLEGSGDAPASAHHPGNTAPVLRETGALAASLAGLGYAAITSLLPIRTLPALLPATLSLTDAVPWMRSAVESRFGRPGTDTALTLGTTVVQTAARQPMSLFIGTCQRFCTSREVLARNRAWRRWERTTGNRPGIHRAGPLENPSRPCPLPDGPIERVANTSGSLALAGYGTVLATTGSSQRALAMLLAGMPRPGKAGREAFAAQLTGTISARGDLIFNPDTLRRLDRVDTVVLDAPALLTGQQVVDTVTTELDPLAESLVEAARSVGSVLVAGRGSRLDQRLPLDGAVPGGNHLRNSVSRLQADGHVVAVVSARGHSALAAADIGIGVPAESGAMPWGAHVLCANTAHVHTVLAAADKARTSSKHSATLSAAAACLGVLLSSLGPASGATFRAATPVHVATLLALMLGTWSGMQAANGSASAGGGASAEIETSRDARP
ncbi:hypothetical protein [Haloactinomyces albus]|uniref:HMA domain-containing protein n=1 Tax=Haloactinomyces albus TaxID=1352928 RepID=A0AAE3ZGC2_9ACTN|nr:hypothetical protein [Haloactinomyces albus]MDR7304416.1 hypothetical protein [Haloactinomyces albus]